MIYVPRVENKLKDENFVKQVFLDFDKLFSNPNEKDKFYSDYFYERLNMDKTVALFRLKPGLFFFVKTEVEIKYLVINDKDPSLHEEKIYKHKVIASLYKLQYSYNKRIKIEVCEEEKFKLDDDDNVEHNDFINISLEQLTKDPNYRFHIDKKEVSSFLRITKSSLKREKSYKDILDKIKSENRGNQITILEIKTSDFSIDDFNIIINNGYEIVAEKFFFSCVFLFIYSNYEYIKNKKKSWVYKPYFDSSVVDAGVTTYLESNFNEEDYVYKSEFYKEHNIS